MNQRPNRGDGTRGLQDHYVVMLGVIEQDVADNHSAARREDVHKTLF